MLLGAAVIALAAMTVPARFAAAQTGGATRIGSGVQVARQSAEERRGRQALELISIRWQEVLPGWRVVFLPSRRGFLGMTYRPERRIEIYVREDRPVRAIAHDIAHELGHAIDVSMLNADRRGRFLELRGLSPETSWWACNACTDLDTGAGDFAETFAWWAAPQYRFYGVLAPAPSADLLEQMAAEVFPEAQAVRIAGDV